MTEYNMTQDMAGNRNVFMANKDKSQPITTWRRHIDDKVVRKIPVITTHVLWFLVQAQLDELLELFTEVSRELRGVVLGYEEEDPHWVHVRVGRLSFR